LFEVNPAYPMNIPIQYYLPIGFCVSVLFSSCITSFHVGQEAETLHKHTLELGIEAGGIRTGAGMRYGFLKNMDVGLYYVLDEIDYKKLEFPPVSCDIKWKFLSTANKHFAVATGLGFGTGVERSLPYDEVVHYSRDSWYNYGGTSLDAYIPLYFSAYFNLGGDRFSFNYNPFVVYRFGFYDRPLAPYYGPADYLFRSMNKGLIGNAFSIGMGDDKFSFFAVVNAEHYYHSGIGLENFEAYLTVAYKIDLLKFKKKKTP
jgi:hypothetical protein